ncbi:MAG: OadG family protein, partial [Sphaerochaetaceae bacterium]|nr:OadG family protein [Sphaerochaetaceae bacterium]
MLALEQMDKQILIQNLKSGVLLLFIGMAIVFCFLTILIFITQLISRLIKISQ